MKFRHDDHAERAHLVPVPAPPKYPEVRYDRCDIRVAGRTTVTRFYRTPLGEARVTDRRVFAFGIDPDDVMCAHRVDCPDRFGYAQCDWCEAHLFCATWVADGVFGDGTVEYANGKARALVARLPRHLTTAH